MKKYLLFCLVCCLSVAFLTSCEKEDMSSVVNTSEINETSEARFSDSLVLDYPVAIDEYVTQNYPDATIEEVTLLDDGNYEALLTTGTELLFDATGLFIEEVVEDEMGDGEEEEEEDMEVTEYPAAIDEYVALNYPDAMIDGVELEEDGSYEVELDNEVELLFDADGNFLEEEIEEEEEEEEESETDMANYVTEYPAAIDEYIGLNHPDTTLDGVLLKEDGTYEAELADGTSWLFDADGNFLGEG